MEAKQKLILYVDDDADDREILVDAIKCADDHVEVALAENGLRAIDYLTTRKNAGANLPCLIILDINMPLLDGKGTYERLKEDALLKSVPVIIFSSSEKPADKAEFNAMGIEFFTKPSSLTYMAGIANHMVSICC